MKTTHKLLIAALACIAVTSCNKEEDNLNDTDRNFLKMASHGNHAETEAGSLAASKAQDSAVKVFGAFMATEHTTAQQDLENLANSKKTDIPSEPDDAHKAMKAQLMQMNGRAFDSAYIHGQHMDHQAVLNLFQNELSNGKNKDVKNYAEKYIHHIQMHFDQTKTLIQKY